MWKCKNSEITVSLDFTKCSKVKLSVNCDFCLQIIIEIIETNNG